MQKAQFLLSVRFIMCKSLEAIHVSTKIKPRRRAANQWKYESEVILDEHVNTE